MRNRGWIGAIVFIVLAQASILALGGQPFWCKCHSWIPWSWVVMSSHNSQHLVDPYSLEWLAVITTLIEAGWELLENSHWVIDRYRAATISFDYYGDSVLNSVGDVGCCLLGFWIASRISGKASIALFVAVELILLFWIRDNLTLNVVMLVHPIEAIRTWQSFH